MSTPPVSLAQVFTDAMREPSYPRYNSDDNGVAKNKQMETSGSWKTKIQSNVPINYGTIPNKWDKESDANPGNKEMKNGDFPGLDLHYKPKEDYDWIKH